MTRTTCIYALRDPENQEIRYIGKSDNPNLRMHAHLIQHYDMREDNPKVLWLQSLQNKGLTPIIEILEQVPSDDWRIAENKWIQHYHQQGCTLTNTMHTDARRPRISRRTSHTINKEVITFNADTETTRQLSELAQRWQTNKSAAIVRCVERAYQIESRKRTNGRTR